MTTADRVEVRPAWPTFLPRLPHLALTRYLPAAKVMGLARALGWRGRRRVFDPAVTLWALVAQALAGGGSQEQVVVQLAAALGVSLSPGSGALCRARQRLASDLAQAATAFVAQLARSYRAAPLGPTTWLLDGTCLALSDTAANQARYPQSSTQRAGCGYPQVHTVALVDQQTGCVGALAVGTLHDHDAKLAQELWDAPARGDLVIGDRGFASYAAQAAAQRRGYGYLYRQHQRRHNQGPLVGDLDDRDEVWARPKKVAPWSDDDLPQQLTVRVVRARLSEQTVLVLNTNLPRAAYSAERVVALYAERWRIETRFLELKCRLGAEPLRAASPDTVATALWGCWLAHNLVSCLLTEAALESGVPRYELSFQAALDALAAAAVIATTDAEQACKWVRAQVTRNRLARRGNRRRDEPRRVKALHRAYTKLTKPRAEYHERARSRAA